MGSRFSGLWCGVLLVTWWFGEFGVYKVFFEVFVSLIVLNILPVMFENMRPW